MPTHRQPIDLNARTIKEHDGRQQTLKEQNKQNLLQMKYDILMNEFNVGKY